MNQKNINILEGFLAAKIMIWQYYNNGHNILRLFDVLPWSFSMVLPKVFLTTSETKWDY